MPKHLRMAHKLWLAVILIVVMLVAVVGFAAYRSAKVQAHADAVSKDMESRVQAALRWSGLTETNAARTQALIVSSDPASVQRRPPIRAGGIDSRQMRMPRYVVPQITHTATHER